MPHSLKFTVVYIYSCLLDTEGLQPGKSQKQLYCCKAPGLCFPGTLHLLSVFDSKNSLQKQQDSSEKGEEAQYFSPINVFLYTYWSPKDTQNLSRPFIP